VQIGLSSWIIQDGNYPDFAVGDVAKFALEFYAPHLQRTAYREPALTPSHPAHYRMSACVRYSHSEACVLDFGCLAYREEPISDIASVGDWVSGDVYVGIDPFFYMESLHALPGIPELRYDWRIEEILLETTPWISTRDSSGREVRTRNESLHSFRSITQTDAWRDDGGHAHYVFRCLRLDHA
jgi:hypothetical protein